MKKALLFLSLVFALLLAGCTAPIVSEEALRKDLAESVNFSRYAEDLGMQISGFEVVKRQSSPDDKTDRVWVHVTAASEAVEGDMYFLMNYGLYNEGWLLDSVSDDNTGSWSFKPLQPVPDDFLNGDIEGDLPENAVNLEIGEIEVDYDNGEEVVAYSYEEPSRYCTVYYDVTRVFRFGTGYGDNAGRWENSYIADCSESEEWDREATSSSYVVDMAGLLGTEQSEALDSQAREISEKYQCGVYIVTVDDYQSYTSGDVYDCATGFFTNNNLGYGDTKDGVLLLLSMADRDYTLIAHGDRGNAAFTDYGKERMADSFLPYFGRDDWKGGFSDYLSTSSKYLEMETNGQPFDNNYGG